MIFHQQSAPRGCLVENAAKVEQRGSEGNGADCEHAQEAELDGQDLVGTCDLDRDAHREFLVLILRRLFVLLDKEAAASLQDAPVWLQFGPDLERPVALDEAQRRVELQVGLEVLREGQLDFHSICSSVVKNDLLTVELLVDQYV